MSSIFVSESLRVLMPAVLLTWPIPYMCANGVHMPFIISKDEVFYTRTEYIMTSLIIS